MKRPGYHAGVAWIATNDESGNDGPDNPDAEANVAAYISTALLADLFGVECERVARDVMRVRRNEAGQ
jgi:hypothetical protein